MDFSNAGVTRPLGGVFRAHVQWKDKGVNRNIQGPRRAYEEAAQRDLERIRKVASGMRCEEGFAAMDAEAKRLREGKAPNEQGSVILFGDSFAAC